MQAAAAQKDILDTIAPMVKVGGTLVYSTCSICAARKTGAQIQAFLDAIRNTKFSFDGRGAAGEAGGA